MSIDLAIMKLYETLITIKSQVLHSSADVLCYGKMVQNMQLLLDKIGQHFNGYHLYINPKLTNMVGQIRKVDGGGKHVNRSK